MTNILTVITVKPPQKEVEFGWQPILVDWEFGHISIIWNNEVFDTSFSPYFQYLFLI
jgi:hypothetical protein